MLCSSPLIVAASTRNLSIGWNCTDVTIDCVLTRRECSANDGSVRCHTSTSAHWLSPRRPACWYDAANQSLFVAEKAMCPTLRCSVSLALNVLPKRSTLRRFPRYPPTADSRRFPDPAVAAALLASSLTASSFAPVATQAYAVHGVDAQSKAVQD